MGRIEKDMFGDGYTVYHDDGTKEHFTQAFFSDDWVGNRGTRHHETFFGNQASTNRAGDTEVFYDALLSDDKVGTNGTRISRDAFGDGYNVTHW